MTTAAGQIHAPTRGQCYTGHEVFSHALAERPLGPVAGSQGQRVAASGGARALAISIRLKLTIAMVGTFVAAIATGVTVTLLLESARLERAHVKTLAGLADILHGRVRDVMMSGDALELQRVLARYAGAHEHLYLQVLRPDYAIVASSPPLSAPLVDRRSLGGFDVPVTVMSTVGIDATARIEPIINRGECSGCHSPGRQVLGYLAVGLSRQPLEERLADLASSASWSGAATLVLLMLASWIALEYLVLRPVRELSVGMRLAAAGDLGVRVEEPRPFDEFSALAAGFNVMIERLGAARAELERGYRQRLARADRFATAGELASGLAHEIRNPLAGLSGALQVFADDFADNPEKREVVAEMRRQLERLDGTVRDLLHFARPAPPTLTRVDLDAIAGRVVGLVRHYRDARLVRFVTQLAATTPVCADPGQLEQVILNLCLNAVQAQPRGGEVRVTSRRDGSEVVLEVADDGPGIAPEARPSIFQPFFTTKTRGTGLGLAISARIIAEHKGSLAFACPDDGGTVFTVRLPALPGDAPADGAAE